MLTLLFTACLLDKQGYLDRLAQLTDADGDGYAAMDDCNDANPGIYPGAPETCDGVDQDCDGIIDNNATDARNWYQDVDGDGHGGSTVTVACQAPAEDYSDVGDDCDDADPNAFPGATEIPYDGVDQDCSGADLTDVDGDGHDAIQAGGDDCDDSDPSVHPGATEIPYDGVDEDCTDGDANDLDGDGVVATEAGGADCDDADASVFPGAEETWANGYTDNNCDGELEPITLEYGDNAWLGERAGAQVGRRLSALGDVTGDGLAEYLAVGLYDNGVHENGGIVYLVSGSAGGSLAGSHTLIATAADEYLGTDIDGGPDVDGDGVPDLALSAAGVNDFSGRTWVISGVDLASGTALDPDAIALGRVTGDNGAVSGLSIHYVGDVMGDGSNWLAVGEPFTTVDGNANAGCVALFSTVSGAMSLADADITVHGYYASGDLSGVLDAGDENGDGYDDFMVTTDAGDVAAIVPGGLTNPVLPDDALFRLSRSTAGTSDREDAQMIGDVDGDGARDLVSIHNTSSLGIFTHLATNPVQIVEDATSTVDFGADSYAYETVDLGDLDGDGRGETLLAVQWYAALGTSLAAIWPGENVTIGAHDDVTDAPLEALATIKLSAWGYRAAFSDDVDGDGSRDIIMGGYEDGQGGAEAGAILTIPVPR